MSRDHPSREKLLHEDMFPLLKQTAKLFEFLERGYAFLPEDLRHSCPATACIAAQADNLSFATLDAAKGFILTPWAALLSAELRRLGTKLDAIRITMPFRQLPGSVVGSARRTNGIDALMD